jgi:hypothetical protein
MGRLAPWLLLLAASLAGAAAEPEVRIERSGDTYAVFARITVDVERSIAWAVITDYNGLRNFVPDMVESRVVSKPGEPTLVRQSGAWSFLGYRVPVLIVARVDELPMRSVRFRSVSGNVRVENGEWSIADQGQGVAIIYRVECTPEFWVPPFLGAVLIRRDVSSRLERIAEEMRRRADPGNKSLQSAPAP